MHAPPVCTSEHTFLTKKGIGGHFSLEKVEGLDIIKAYTIMHRKKVDAFLPLSQQSNQGTSNELNDERFKRDKKRYFSRLWNSLGRDVVRVNSLDSFTRGFDKFRKYKLTNHNGYMLPPRKPGQEMVVSQLLLVGFPGTTGWHL